MPDGIEEEERVILATVQRLLDTVANRDDLPEKITGRGDLMSRLLAARDADGRGLSDQELSDQVAVLLLAGGETTSAAVVWSLHLLGGHPEILGALQAETDAVLGTDVAGWEHLPRLDLTARVVREALRLYPPAWAIPRISVRETSLAGRTLPAGSMVVFNQSLQKSHTQ